MCILNTNVCMIRMSVIFFSRHAFCNTFSTHDLSWRSTDTIATMIAAITFQLTTSRGGRQYGCIVTPYSLLFQLTTSRGGRLIIRKFIRNKPFFNSRPLVEVDKRLPICPPPYFIFNSRPLVEVDLRLIMEENSLKLFNSRPLVEVDNILFCM